MLKKKDDCLFVNDDALKTKAVADSTVDLVVTSPPYNVDINYESSSNDMLSTEDYMEFSRNWLTRCYHWLKDDGRIAINVSPTTQKNGNPHSLSSDILQVAKSVGLRYKTTIIWDKMFPNNGFFYGSWMSASSPNIWTDAEHILVLFKNQWKKLEKGVSTVTKEEFSTNMKGIWRFQPSHKQHVGHPASFPLELPLRCIKMLTYKGDTVLDPFLGSGTTMIACHETQRRGIGIELSPEYYEMALQRYTNATAQTSFL